MTKIVLAYYDDVEQARQSGRALLQAGIPEKEIGIVPQEQGSNGNGLLKGGTSGDGLVQELNRFNVPNEEAKLYAKGIAHGGGFVIARVEDDMAQEAASVLDQQPVIDIETRAQEWNQQAPQGEQRSQEGQTLQAVEEELQVGKREVRAGGVRIRSQVEERPVEETVRLREEEINVERKAVDRQLSPEEAEKAFQDRTVEVSATREQAVVSKQAHVTEEVVVGKTQREREEKIRDTVRSTKLNVEQDVREKADS